MKGVLFDDFVFLVPFICGGASHLLLTSQGEGSGKLEGWGNERLKRASYLPKNQLISLPAQRFGNLAAGFQFRFGSETRFELEEIP